MKSIKMDSSENDLKVFEVLQYNKKILKLERSLITSRDLDQTFDSEIDEIHIICDTLSLDSDLSANYRGRNIRVVANEVKLEKAIIWDVSGNDGSMKFTNDASTNENGIGNNGNDGESGGNGGNIEIICDNIYNYSLWTIESNGGNGSNAQNGGCGAHGVDGKSVQMEDLSINGEQVTNVNFSQLISNLCVSTNFGSRHKSYFEDGLEKLIIFNRDSKKSEMIMLVKGSKGKHGQRGGSEGKGGRGGKSGKINNKLKFIAKDGCDGNHGLSGFNGRVGKNGNDAYLIVRSTETKPVYGGLEEHLNFQVISSTAKKPNSIYYQKSNEFLSVIQSNYVEDNMELIRNTNSIQSETLASYEAEFCKHLINVLKNSNNMLPNILNKLNIHKILSKSDELNNILTLILKYTFDIREYDILKHLARSLTAHSVTLSDKIFTMLSEVAAAPEITAESNDVLTIKRKILTSEEIEDIDEYFIELRVICDILHINSSLSDKFRGKNFVIFSNLIHVHNQTEWDFSGRDKSPRWSDTAGKHSNGQGIDGNDGEPGESGGNCTIKCNKIINPSLLSIKSNGRNGLNGQNGGDADYAVDGKNPGIEDFKIDGKEINADLLKNVKVKETFHENGLEKTIYVQSNAKYLMLTKGSKGRVGRRGGAGGRGGCGGFGGQITIQTDSNDEILEIQQQSLSGENGCDGSNGQNANNTCWDGCHSLMYVKDGTKEFIGLNQSSFFEIWNHHLEYDHSVYINNEFYYPERTHLIQNPKSIFDDFNFYENLISVLRNSSHQFNELVDKIKLKSFVKYNKSLRDVVSNVAEHDFKIPHYEMLQDVARKYKIENENSHKFIRQNLEEFTKELSMEESSNVIVIKKKILRSSEFTSRYFASNVEEFQIICDTLYVDSDLSSSFLGKNLAILCNFFKVTKKAVWNLSGNSSIAFESDTGQESSGKGNDGDDGTAGQSGGNFTLECKFLNNGQLLTIISNGGDGADGQNGGDGKDGNNGKDATESDFYVGELILKTPLDNNKALVESRRYHIKWTGRKPLDSNYFYRGFERIEYVSNNGLDGFFYRLPEVCIVLVKGGKGEPGKLGGIGGFGGEAGYPGKISITCENQEDNLIKIITNYGNAGKDGLNGINGLHGRDGGDIHKFDYGLWTAPFIDGNNRLAKFKLTKEFGYISNALGFFLTAGINQISQYKVYSDEEHCYLKVEEDGAFVYPSNKKYRNDSSKLRSKKSHAVSSKKTNIDGHSIKNKNSQYLTLDQVPQFANEITTVDQTKLNVINAIKNPEIDINQIQKEHGSYLSAHVAETSNFTIFQNELQLSIIENQHLVDKLQISKVRQMRYDKSKKKKRIRRKYKLAVRNESQAIDYNCLRSTNIDKTAAECFEFIKMSKLNQEQYSYLIKNIQKLNISENECSAYLINLKESIDLKSKGGLDEITINMKNFKTLFIETIQKCLSGDTYQRIEDVKNLCEEKYLSLIYKEIYNFFNQLNQSIQAEEISFNSFNFQHQFPFLKDSKEFNSKSDNLNKHFNINSANERDEIIDYFNKNYKNTQSSLPESIFNYFLNNINIHRKISTILSQFVNRIRIFDGKKDETIENSEDEELIKKSIKQDEFSSILKNFFDTKEIIKYIKDELKNLGINSPIYRKILSHKYGFKFVICKLALDDRMKVFEWHNFRNDLRFKYNINEVDVSNYESSGLMTVAKNKFMGLFASQKNENESEFSYSENEMEEIFIFLNYSNFSILNFEKEKYKNFQQKEENDKNFKQVALVLKHVKKSGFDSLENSFVEEKSSSCLKEIVEKLKIVENKFAEVFQSAGDDEADLLCGAIILNFPTSFYSIDDENVELYEADNENLKEFSNSKSDFIMKNEEMEFSRIKCIFRLISQIGGTPILKALTVQLNNNKNFYSLEEFIILIKSIFLMLWKKEAFVVPITFMILGNEPELWFSDLILTKIDSIYGIVNENTRNKWKSKLTRNKMNRILPILLEKISNLEKNEDFEEPNIEEFDQIIDNLDYLDDECCDNFRDTNLKVWGTITTDKYWNINFDKLEKYHNSVSEEVKLVFEDMSSKYGIKTRKLMDIFIDKKDQISKINLKEFSSNFTNGTWLFGDNVLNILKNSSVDDWNAKLNSHFYTTKDTKTAQTIINIMKNDDETSTQIKTKIDKITSQFDILTNSLQNIEKYNENELISRTQSKDVIELLAIITKAFKLIGDIELRDTQLISILTMINSGHGALVQISTGEGKTFIGVAFAILKILQGEKVDIVTSSSVLAERDALNKENRKIFDFFNIKVDHNCHEKNERRQKAYECDIVYGTLCNFQRDYLLTEFHEQKIMSDHHFENILVDEVDSMLLDKGNNILYLSQDLPDLDEIETILIFIWQWINQKFESLEEMSEILDTNIIRKVVLDNIYGILNEDDIKKMQHDVDADKIIQILQDLKLIDHEYVLSHENFKKQDILLSLNSFDRQLGEKVIKFCCNKFDRECQLTFPKHLKAFVLQHLNKWIESGIRAMYLQNGKEYIIDRPKTGQMDESADINIIDLDTGTDMPNSQWDEGLHQFLQIKHGCKLSSLSLKSVFISNVSFFKKYVNLYGMTGTLGSLQERQKITKIHKIDFVTIPRYITRKFEEYLPIAKDTKVQWLESINNEVKKLLQQNRSILIICETIQDTQAVHKVIKGTLDKDKILLYQRDSDNFKSEKLQSGYVIISTNLAGRGTDIKLSERLAQNGGLHVILTNLPENSRIEEQALGRASRCGEQGTGRLIIYTEKNTSLSKLKEARNQTELKRLDEISIYYENFIKIEENFFEKFQSAYRKLKSELSTAEDVYLLNFVIQWSFWLDQNSKLLDNWKNVNNATALQENFEKFLSEKQSLHPVMRIELYKELVGKDGRSLSLTKFANACLETINIFSKTALERSEIVLKEDFHDDLFVHHYLKLYGMMKTNQEKYNYKPRDLFNEEQDQIRKCLKMVQSAIKKRQMITEIVKYFKSKTPKNMSSIEGFENQQREILEIYEEIYRSLKVLLGEDINPDTLGTAIIDNNAMKNELYEELLNIGCIEPPKISENYSYEDLEMVSQNNTINVKDLKKFLENNCDEKIKSMKKFEDRIKNTFKMPSRVEFWNILINNGILIDEIEYGIVDLNEIKNVDPSAGELVLREYKSETFDDVSSSTIFFSMMDKEEIDGKIIIKMKSLKSEFTTKRLNYLMENNVIEVNKQATFDMKKYQILKYTNIFGSFERIKQEDFENICKNHKKIIEKLISPKIGVLVPQLDQTYALNYENLCQISHPHQLGEDYVYHTSIYELLQHKFAYKIAIESIVEDIKDEMKSTIIRLNISPHTNLLNDLMYHQIIEKAKVNETNLENCENLFKNSKISDIFDSIGFNANADFIAELMRKKLLDSNHNIQKFNINEVEFSNKYKHIESTALFLLQNRRILIENVKEIKANLKNLIKPLRNKELESIEIVLVPVVNFLPRNGYSTFMELKGLGSVIKVQQQMYR